MRATGKGMVAVVTAVAAAAVFSPAAATKEFEPGDLRVCAGNRCVAVTARPVLTAMSAFYYGGRAAERAHAPAPRARYVELRFRNGYVTGIAAGVRFDRFLSFGVNLDRFKARTWYAVPAGAAAEIRRLAGLLRPRPLPRDVLARSH
jgi:hypothetical protein